MTRLRIFVSAAALLLVLPLVMSIALVDRAAAQDQGAVMGGTLPISGMIEDENGEVGSFQGSVSELMASGDDELALDGLIDGLAFIGDDVVRVAGQEFSNPVQPSVVGAVPADEYTMEDMTADGEATPVDGAESDDSAGLQVQPLSYQTDTTTTEPDPGVCDVLFLDIQPIELNLLGLQLTTSRITLDLNAIPGEGNLLGNLVCALAGLLDGTPDAIGELTDRLNEILSGAGVGSDEIQPDATEAPADGETPLADSAEETPADDAVATEPTDDAAATETPAEASPVTG